MLAHERIRAARHHLERTEEIALARHAALSAVPAPTGAEGRRAARVAELFREVGLQDVLIDEVGNVRGWTAGAGGSGKRDGGPVVLAAHLDTVFGPDVNVAVERRGRRLRGPGISDNARGLAALVAVAEAVVAARVPAARPSRWAAPWRCSPTCRPPPLQLRARRAPSCAWAAAPDSTLSRRTPGSTSTCGARIPRHWPRSTPRCAPRSSGRSATRTTVVRPPPP